jgi:hypothetical protein
MCPEQQRIAVQNLAVTLINDPDIALAEAGLDRTEVSLQ